MSDFTKLNIDDFNPIYEQIIRYVKKTFISRALVLDIGKLVTDYKEQELEEGELLDYLRTTSRYNTLCSHHD